jgi:hypothetical protein
MERRKMDWSRMEVTSSTEAVIYTKPLLSQGSRPAATLGNQADFGYRDWVQYHPGGALLRQG